MVSAAKLLPIPRDFTQDMGPGPGQREESQRETTITLRQPEIRLRFDILSLSLSAQCPQHHITFHNHRQGARAHPGMNWI